MTSRARLDPTRTGIGLIGFGLLALLTLRLWASPIAGTILGRESVQLVSFLGIPALLVVLGAGIVLFVWGDDLLGR